MRDNSIGYLKKIVIVMGILIVVGFVFLGIELSKRIAAKKNIAETITADSSITYLNLPKNARIIKSFMDAGRLSLFVSYTENGSETAQKTQRIYLIDTKSGAIVQIYDLSSE